MVDQLNFLGVRRTWGRLLNGECGVESISARGPAFRKLQCQVAGIVQQGNREDGGWMASEWLSRDVRLLSEERMHQNSLLTYSKDERRTARFMQFAIVAAKEALDDANWRPQEPIEQEMTVCFQFNFSYTTKHN